MKTRTSVQLALAVAAAVGMSSAFANDAADSVYVAQLTVKERLTSIEQINVTAEKEVTQAASEDPEVLALLAELQALEAEDE